MLLLLRPMWSLVVFCFSWSASCCCRWQLYCCQLLFVLFLNGFGLSVLSLQVCCWWCACGCWCLLKDRILWKVHFFLIPHRVSGSRGCLVTPPATSTSTRCPTSTRWSWCRRPVQAMLVLTSGGAMGRHGRSHHVTMLWYPRSKTCNVLGMSWHE